MGKNIYENIEPNESTSLFPQLSEQQLSLIGGSSSNNNLIYNGQSKIRVVHLYNGTTEYNLQSGEWYTYRVPENRYAEQNSDIPVFIDVQSIVGKKYQVLLHITESSLLNVFDHYVLNYFRGDSGTSLGDVQLRNNVLTEIDVPSNGIVRVVKSLLFELVTKGNVNYDLDNIGIFNLIYLIPVP